MLSRESLTIRDLLESCSAERLDSGTLVCTSTKFLDFNYCSDRLPDEPFQLAVTLKGDEFRRKYPEYLELLDPVNLRSPERRSSRDEYNYRIHQLGGWPKTHYLAVQDIPRWQAGLNAVQHLAAIEVLRKQGLLLAPPLMATRWVYVCRWPKGSKLLFDVYFKGLREAKIAEIEKEFDDYLFMLKWTINKLGRWGEWSKDWKIDTHKDNYLLGNLNARDPRKRFIALDPVYAEI